MSIALVLFLALSRNVLHRYARLEENFMQNLNAKEQESAPPLTELEDLNEVHEN